MATMTIKTKIQLRNDTAARWTSANPVLLKGEAGYENDTRKLKFGDGSTAWNSLPYFSSGGSGGSTYTIKKQATPESGYEVTYYLQDDTTAVCGEKINIPVVPTNVSAFTNDAGYLTQHQSLAGYATESWVESKGYITSSALTPYRTSDDQDVIDDQLSTDIQGKVTSSVTIPNVGTSVVSNTVGDEGSCLQFTHQDGTISGVAVNGGGKDGIDAQLYALDSKTLTGARVDVSTNGIYYTVGNQTASQRMTDNNKIAVKGDIENKQEKLTAGSAISLTNNVVAVKYDNDTIKLNSSGNLYADVSGAVEKFTAIYSDDASKCTSFQDIRDAYDAGKILEAKYTDASGGYHFYALVGITSLVAYFQSMAPKDVTTAKKQYSVAGRGFKVTSSGWEELNNRDWDSLSAGNGIKINAESNFSIDANVDNSTIKINSNNEIYAVSDSTKQDVIPDLDTIRSGAALGATAIQEHQDISGKLNVLPKVDDPSDPGFGWEYHIPYNFEATPDAEKLNITLKTLTLDNKVTKMNFSKTLPAATTSTAGLMSAEDKQKLENKINLLGNVDDPSDPGYGYPYHFPYDAVFTANQDNITIGLKTITLDNNKYKMTFDKQLPAATESSIGLMKASDAKAVRVDLPEAINTKVTKLGNVDDPTDPGYGFPYHLPYDASFSLSADKLTLGIKTINIDDKGKMVFNKELPAATTTTAGLMSANDKVTLSGKQDKLISGTNIKTINNKNLLGSGNISINTYSQFPIDFKTNGTLQEFVDSVNSSSGAATGKAYVGELRGACSPIDGNVECKVEYIYDDIAIATASSADVAPYRWELNTAIGVWRKSSDVIANPTSSATQQVSKLSIDGTTFGISGELNQALTANVTVGGISAGDTFDAGTSFETILRKLLIRKQLTEISITNPPSKVTYNAGESFQPSGVQITASYNDSSSKVVTDYTYSPTGPLTTADTKITFSYSEGGITKTTEQAITVVQTGVTIYLGGAGSENEQEEPAEKDLATMTSRTIANPSTDLVGAHVWTIVSGNNTAGRQYASIAIPKNYQVTAWKDETGTFDYNFSLVNLTNNKLFYESDSMLDDRPEGSTYQITITEA